jgi:hypothetical protein
MITVRCILTVFEKNEEMKQSDKIQVDLVKLQNGERLLRLTDLLSGLVLEKKLDPDKAVVSQKDRLFDALEAALIRHRMTVA